MIDGMAIFSDLLRTAALALFVVAGWVWRDVVREVKTLRARTDDHAERIARIEGAHVGELHHGTH